MAQMRRWGKGYVDDRDWKEYNESLVRRGEILLDFDLLDEWSEELKKANQHKVGAPYRYPEAFMRLLAYLHVLFHLPFRQEEGFVRSLSRYVDGLKAPDWSTIWERTKGLDMTLEGVRTDQPISIALDSSGIKVSNAGDWMRKKWKVKRGYLKIHLAVDARSKQAVSMQVTEETVSDGSQTGSPRHRGDREERHRQGVCRRGVRQTSELQPPRLVGHRPRDQGEEERVEKGEGELRQEGGGDRTTDRLRGMEEGEALWRQVGCRGSVLGDQADVRRVCLSEEVREHGSGDGHEDIALQYVHADDTPWWRRRIIPHSIFRGSLSCPNLWESVTRHDGVPPSNTLLI